MAEKHISMHIQDGMARASNYNRIIVQAFRPYLGDRILEVGSSIGNITSILLETTEADVVSTDILGDALDEQKNRLAHFGDRLSTQSWDLNQVPPKALKKGSFDSIVCPNVLEHVARDERALHYMFELLKTDGYLCLMVPALQWLYGSVDRTDHHFRRYHKQELMKRVDAGGYNIISCSYFNLTGVAAWYLMGRILKKKTIDSTSIGFYDRLFPLFHRIEKMLGPFLGQSLVLIAKK